MTEVQNKSQAAYERKRRNQQPSKAEPQRQSVIQIVETKNPLVRQFGVPSFKADTYHAQIIAEQDSEQLHRTVQ